MKIVTIERLIDAGLFSKSAEWELIRSHITEAIRAVEWPSDSGSFTIYPQSGKKRGEGNGVKPIKDAFITYLNLKGWQTETESNFAKRKRVRSRSQTEFDFEDTAESDILEETPFTSTLSINPGGMDATYRVAGRLFCVEWETGNISSSHRAVNKMALGILSGVLIGGALILPTKALAQYLTDRVGNFPELAPYFPLWRSLKVDEGLLLIIAIEHDAVSFSVERIPKGTDGRALL